ncbi:MAG: hypothetical protein WAL58_15565 [Terriglobales bacterium]
MSNAHKHLPLSLIVVAASALLSLAACGSGSRLVKPVSVSETIAKSNDSATDAYTGRNGAGKATPIGERLTGGASTEIAANLAAPIDDVAAQLESSDAIIVATPATAPSFKVAMHPSTITVAPGESGSTNVTTTVTLGYDHALHLTTSNVPAGVSVILTPKLIAAPGGGTAVAEIKVHSSVADGRYAMEVIASDGTTSQSAKLTLNVASTGGPAATFQGCWYKHGSDSYQGVHVTVANAGTYSFNALLYSGATCNPNDWADEFGYGQLLQFSPDYEWTFWFTHFPNQTNMSAIWYVGNEQSQCVNYNVAPDC